MPLRPEDGPYVRLLELGAFERRERGGWRFGTKVIADRVVERLVDRGHAETDGRRVWLVGLRNSGGLEA